MVVFIFTAVLLSIIQIKASTPLLLFERFYPSLGWLEILMLSTYALWISKNMLDPSRTAKWRLRIWSFFSIINQEESMKSKSLTMLFVFFVLSGVSSMVFADICVQCHKVKTPNIVSDWERSQHKVNDVGCATCHGDGHNSAKNVDKAEIPTPETCGQCHDTQVEQFKKGKHAVAWAAMKAMPTAHMQPMALTEGMKGCGGCHKIGLKTDAEMKQLRAEGAGYGVASCDACHTRHLFSKAEAREPQACQTCHMGIDHPQWEMYSSSKHGVRYLLKQIGILPETVAAPKCQTCHFQEGDHEVGTAWGFLAVRLPMPEDEQWAADRTTILQGLGVLDPQGNPTERLEVVKAANVARLTQEEWQKERDKMLNICNDCHSKNFAAAELREKSQH